MGIGVALVWRICCEGRGGLVIVSYLVLQFLASWPTFLHLKHLPSFIHLAHSWGVSFLSRTVSTSMALGSRGVRGVGHSGIQSQGDKCFSLICQCIAFAHGRAALSQSIQEGRRVGMP